jgi:small subunit ribosomal protein S17
MVGRVVSVKMTKTAVVIVESKKTHPIYKKSFVHTKKFLVDDPFTVALGDMVIFDKIAPISKRKHWRITKVLGRDIVSLEQAELLEEAQEAIAEVMPEAKEESSSENLELSEASSQVSTEEVQAEKKPAKKSVAKKETPEKKKGAK